MKYENDFVDEKPVEIDIEGRKFKYKPTTGRDENNWLKHILEIEPETKQTRINWTEYNKLKLGNVLSVPYDKVLIKKILGIEKEWNDLLSEDRFKLLGQLKPGLFDKLINAIKKVDEKDNKSVKN